MGPRTYNDTHHIITFLNCNLLLFVSEASNFTLWYSLQLAYLIVVYPQFDAFDFTFTLTKG